MDGFMLVAGGTALLTGLGIVENLVHRRRLDAIPIRIHVNGTRGKSGVTRLIAAGLRAGGIRTCAKTTGTLARMIFPDGSEYPVHRPARANVSEQFRIVRAAVRARAEALVVECMALQPTLQALCELKLIRATHGVITNARADHLDVMGPNSFDVAKSLAGTVPVAAKLYTAEQRHLGMFRYAAQDRESSLVTISDEDTNQVRAEELQQFSYIEHPDNVALALAVCQDLGVSRETALHGMWNATPDPGVMTVSQVQDAGSQIAFVNGFAANDPESTGKIWELVVARYRHLRRRIAIVNCRADRADRSEQLAAACLDWTPADHYLVVGSGTEFFIHRAAGMGLHRRQMTRAEGQDAPQLTGQIHSLANGSALVMGMGNIATPGLQLVDYYREREKDTSGQGTMSFRKAA